MFIDGIKAVPNDSTEVKIWRFRYDQGQHRNLCVIAVPDHEQGLMRAAVRLALFGLRDPSVPLRAALVQISDNSGESWVFERQGEQFRCFKARQFFDARPEQCLKELFRDYLPENADSFSFAQLLKEYDLSYDGQALEARLSPGQQPRLSLLEKSGLERKAASYRALAEAFGLKQNLNRGQIAEILQLGEGLSRRLSALQQQAQEIEKTFHQLSRIDAQLAAKLEKEVALISQINHLAEPLLDPGKHPRILFERLREVEKELEELVNQAKTPTIQVDEAEVAWPEVLQSLTRYLASDKLEKAARKTLHEAKNQLKPAFDAYKQAIAQFLQYDHHLIQELETCLKELDGHVRLGAIEQERQRDNIAGKLNKLLGFDAEKARGEGSLGPHTLELSRAAVNQCLHHLGRLYAELEQNQGEHDLKLQDLEQRYEKIHTEANRAREHWQNLSRQLQIPLEIGVRDLVNCINQRSRISLLQQRRQRMHEEMQEQRQQYKALAQLLEEWRVHTGSQKSVKLDQSLTILAEARALLQYADKKKSQLKKLEAVTSKFEAYQQIKAKLGQDLELVQDRWRQALSAWGIPLQRLELESWERIAQLSREIVLLEELFGLGSKPLRNEMVFAAEALEAPLTFYHLQELPQGNKPRLHILQQVELADDAGLALIFTSDKLLIEMLLKLGLSRCQVQEPKVEAPTAPAPNKNLMSEKARAALEIFAAKQGSATRNSL